MIKRILAALVATVMAVSAGATVSAERVMFADREPLEPQVGSSFQRDGMFFMVSTHNEIRVNDGELFSLVWDWDVVDDNGDPTLVGYEGGEFFRVSGVVIQWAGCDENPGTITNEQLAEYVADGTIPADTVELQIEAANLLTDISPLAELTELRNLCLSSRGYDYPLLTDLSPLDGLTNLEVLNVIFNSPAGVIDALAVLRDSVGLDNSADVETHDFNDNGVLDVGDALLVLRGVVGLGEEQVITTSIDV